MSAVHPFHCSHHADLVALSFVVSVLGSFCALQCARVMADASGSARRGWLVAASVAMGGGGIWSMHFIAMLACRLPVEVVYDVPTTALSLVVAVVFTAAGLALWGRVPRPWWRVAAAGLLMGLGVASMHYIGMAAMRLPARIEYRPGLVVLSVLIAIAAATAALSLAFARQPRWRRAGSALVMGIAVSGMHYTAMAAATFVPVAASPADAVGLTPDRLARAVFAVTTVVLLLLWGLTGRQARQERANAVRSLRESEQRYRALFESSPEPMWLYDLETALLVDVNAAALGLYGLSGAEARTMKVTDFADDAGAAGMEEMVAANRRGHEARVEATHRLRGGDHAHVEIVASPVELAGRQAGLAVVRDVTANRRMAEQLRHAAQMEAVGRLAGGVAHDFNNLLTAISGYADLLLRRAPPEPITRYGTEIKRAADAAAGLTRQLLAFSRKQVLQPRVVDLNAVMRDAERMLRRLIGEDIELTTRYAEGPAPVRADPVQLEQVILNLAVNARDAMPEGGRLSIRTETGDVAPGRDHRLAGPYVSLVVSDNGIGMEDEVRRHIFEPFFTTKPVGHGTGLGLATVYGIVTQSGGSVAVDSAPGAGTTFTVLFPRSLDQVDGPKHETAVISGGSETVMLVEDEPAIRALTQELLDQLGYRVLVADDCEGALALARRHTGAIHLLLTDVIMPVMAGPQLAKQVVELHPETRVLFMSGYTAEMITNRGILFEGTTLLQKPFTLDDLGLKVRSVLDAA